MTAKKSVKKHSFQSKLYENILRNAGGVERKRGCGGVKKAKKVSRISESP